MMHEKKIIIAGKSLQEANKALIMVHGRGATAEDILSLADYLAVKDYALIAPQATNNTWYPLSFLALPKQNEPWLSSALSLLNEIVKDLNNENITTDHIYFIGFSQGACLTLEFVTRNAKKYGGVVAFTGGLIGNKIYPENYKGDFENTSVFIGSSNPDPHIPVQRVKASADIMQSMHAKVTTKVYDNMGHTINEDEIQNVNSLIFSDK
jgi:phospholipase/carboxylesterase